MERTWVAAASHQDLQGSRDPRFIEKLTDVVGLYLNPPDKALVLWGVGYFQGGVSGSNFSNSAMRAAS